ncbi:hypothetical protein HYV57_02830 [Candidatus Peregrinibacteria bacterium]|nr:hypothetical protein [Candidatus Peregrinibacteria bacterium]
MIQGPLESGKIVSGDETTEDKQALSRLIDYVDGITTSDSLQEVLDVIFANRNQWEKITGVKRVQGGKQSLAASGEVFFSESATPSLVSSSQSLSFETLLANSGVGLHALTVLLEHLSSHLTHNEDTLSDLHGMLFEDDDFVQLDDSESEDVLFRFFQNPEASDYLRNQVLEELVKRAMKSFKVLFKILMCPHLDQRVCIAILEDVSKNCMRDELRYLSFIESLWFFSKKFQESDGKKQVATAINIFLESFDFSDERFAFAALVRQKTSPDTLRRIFRDARRNSSDYLLSRNDSYVYALFDHSNTPDDLVDDLEKTVKEHLDNISVLECVLKCSRLRVSFIEDTLCGALVSKVDDAIAHFDSLSKIHEVSLSRAMHLIIGNHSVSQIFKDIIKKKLKRFQFFRKKSDRDLTSISPSSSPEKESDPTKVSEAD